ncbi:MAG: zinc finger domain-containing protein, partial [Myxococcota bacterium]|nr:zinc finger domain-containing protein [Myxococcota bacterium]
QTKSLTDLVDRFADQSRNMDESVEHRTEELNKATMHAVEQADEIRLVGEAGDGGGPDSFRVYRRAGSPCPRCTHLVERVVLAGRSTFFCGVCQRSPAAGSGAG